MEARLERHTLQRRANCVTSDPERSRRQRYRARRPSAAELDGADDRAVTIDAAGAARAIETIEREKLAGYEAPCGVGGKAFRARRTGCEQDQNHHPQPCNHTEPSPVRQRQQLATRRVPLNCAIPTGRMPSDNLIATFRPRKTRKRSVS